MRRIVRFVALVGCALALAGCSTLAALDDLRSGVQDLGYTNVNVNHQNTNGDDVLVIEASRDEEVSREDIDEVAELAWTTYPAEIDLLQIVLNGQIAAPMFPDDLTSRFGERPDDLGADSSSGGSTVIVIVVALGCAAVFGLIVVLVWRRGRRPPPGQNPPYPQYPPPYPPPYPPGQYPMGPPQ